MPYLISTQIAQSRAFPSLHCHTATMPECAASNDYDGRMGTRISSIFVILVASTFGAYDAVTRDSKH